MARNLQTWFFIKQNLELEIPVVLLYVLKSLGSCPGREGFCMAVNQKGDLAGSVGGGIMEHKFVEMAKDMLQIANAQVSIHRQIHDKSAPKQQSGMICSGEQTILIYPIKSTDFEAIGRLNAAFENGKTRIITLKTEGIEFEFSPWSVAHRPLSSFHPLRGLWHTDHFYPSISQTFLHPYTAICIFSTIAFNKSISKTL